MPALFNLDSGHTYLFPGGAAGKALAGIRREMPEILTVMQDIVCVGADLTVFHRFSAAEAGGMGFAAEIALMIEAGIPFLTTVEPSWMATWRAFAGNGCILLPPSLEAMFAWVDRVWDGDCRMPRHGLDMSGAATAAVRH